MMGLLLSSAALYRRPEFPVVVFLLPNYVQQKRKKKNHHCRFVEGRVVMLNGPYRKIK